MTAVRDFVDKTPTLTISDGRGGVLYAMGWGAPSTPEDPDRVTLTAGAPGDRTGVVGLDLDDGLELLSFLADALGVTGTEPGEPTP